jgi:hypothetical protein
MATDADWDFGADEPAAGTRQIGSFQQPRPPLLWLLVALVATVVGGAVAGVLGGFLPFAFFGWALAGPVAVLAFGHFLHRTTVVSSMAGYGEPSWLPLASRVFPVLVLVAVALASWHIADWASRL